MNDDPKATFDRMSPWEETMEQERVPGVASNLLPVSLALSDKDRLLITSGPMSDGRADVIRKANGSIGWFRLGRVYRRVEPT